MENISLEQYDGAFAYIVEHLKVFNLSGLAKEIKMPRSTLNSVIKKIKNRYGEIQTMPEKHKPNLIKTACKFGYKIPLSNS